MKIRLTKSAVGDLDSVESYIAGDDPGAAARTVLRIIEAAEGLEAFPNLGRPGRISGTRELVVGGDPYIAVYRVRQNVVWVLRVLHAARRWPGD